MKHLLVTVILALAATGANASIIYDVDRTFYDDGTGMVTGTVTGFISTDGTMGVLSVTNIEDWSLTLSADNLNGGIPDTINKANGVTSLDGTAVTATETQLLFDFGAEGDSLLFLAGSSNNFWCLETRFCTGDGINFTEQIGLNDDGGKVAQYVQYPDDTILVFANAAVIPVPSAVWLFGSGLIGLIGFARRKR